MYPYTHLTTVPICQIYHGLYGHNIYMLNPTTQLTLDKFQ